MSLFVLGCEEVYGSTENPMDFARDACHFAVLVEDCVSSPATEKAPVLLDLCNLGPVAVCERDLNRAEEAPRFYSGCDRGRGRALFAKERRQRIPHKLGMHGPEGLVNRA